MQIELQRPCAISDYCEYQGIRVRNDIIVLSEDGRKYLRAQQEELKREIVKAAALRPKQIGKYWTDWGMDRPADAALPRFIDGKRLWRKRCTGFFKGLCLDYYLCKALGF